MTRFRDERMREQKRMPILFGSHRLYVPVRFGNGAHIIVKKSLLGQTVVVLPVDQFKLLLRRERERTAPWRGEGRTQPRKQRVQYRMPSVRTAKKRKEKK